jgi:hypothetical protein
MCERWDFCRGFSIDWSRHKNIPKDYRKAYGPKHKTGVFSYLGTKTNRNARGAEGSSWRRRRWRFGQRGARMRPGMRRGDWGDRVHVLTGVGAEGEEAEFRRQAELGRTTAAVAGSTSSSGSTPGCPTMRSERWLAQKASLRTLGVEARALGTRRAGSSSVHGDWLEQYM